MTTTVSPAVVRADRGRRAPVVLRRRHAHLEGRAEETRGAFLLFEDRMEQGKMTPLHIHPDSDETMYVLEGEILMHLDGRQERVAAGGVAMAPRGVPHAFMVVSPVARMLCLHTPGSCESFYWGASEPIDGDGAGSGIVDLERVRASGQHHGGIQFVGPPPFEAAPPARVVRAG